MVLDATGAIAMSIDANDFRGPVDELGLRLGTPAHFERQASARRFVDATRGVSIHMSCFRRPTRLDRLHLLEAVFRTPAGYQPAGCSA